MTLKEAKTMVSSFGLTLRYDPATREYQVLVPGNQDATYFTDDRQDAVDTAVAMAQFGNTSQFLKRAKGIHHIEKALFTSLFGKPK